MTKPDSEAQLDLEGLTTEELIDLKVRINKKLANRTDFLTTDIGVKINWHQVVMEFLRLNIPEVWQDMNIFLSDRPSREVARITEGYSQSMGEIFHKHINLKMGKLHEK